MKNGIKTLKSTPLYQKQISLVFKKNKFPVQKMNNKKNQNRLPINLYLLTLSLLVKSTYGSFLHWSF